MNANNIESLDKRLCNGCECCAQICPKSAIQMIEDKNGFLYPSIDNSKCIHCGLCLKKCSNKFKKFFANPKCVYAYNSDDSIRINSSSGGAFSDIAEFILLQSGVVCAAAYDHDFSVKHIFIDNADDLKLLRSSKFIQSRINNVFYKVYEYLLDNVLVLFVGTPCQVASLRQFLDGIDTSNLVCIDLICSGVPSYKILKNYVSQFTSIDNVKSINFRDTRCGCGYKVKIINKQDEIFEQSLNECEYILTMLNGLSIRESCSVCKFAKEQRCGDISLGDFSGITNICHGVYDKKGTSLIIINNHTQITNKIRDYLYSKNNCFKKIRFSKKVKYYNQRLAFPTFCNPNRVNFLSDLKKMSFKKASEIGLKPKYHVAILNYWWGNNYGSILTAFALQKMVEILGYSSCLVGFSYDSIENFYRGVSDNFSRKYLKTTPLIREDSLSNLNDITDRFIVGSDQVFSNRYMHDSFFLNFANLKKLKIAYSASFGKMRFKCRSKFLQSYKYLLSRFNFVSVREYSGIDACSALGFNNAVHIIDPVFSIDKSEYIKISKGSSLTLTEDYILVYILDLTKQIADKCKSIAATLNLNCKFIRVGVDSVEDWVNLYLSATYIITDSFHGTCFSIIFNKVFICIENNLRGKERFKSLKKSLNIPEYCFVDKLSFISNSISLTQKIDYAKINSTIKKFNKDAWKFLYNVLSCPLPTYDENDLKEDEFFLSKLITPKCTNGAFILKYFKCFDSLLSSKCISELCIYGAGEICHYLIKYCEYRNIKIIQVFDSYPELKGECILGNKIFRFSEHKLKNDDYIFIASIEFKDQIFRYILDNLKNTNININIITM